MAVEAPERAAISNVGHRPEVPLEGSHTKRDASLPRVPCVDALDPMDGTDGKVAGGTDGVEVTDVSDAQSI